MRPLLPILTVISTAASCSAFVVGGSPTGSPCDVAYSSDSSFVRSASVAAAAVSEEASTVSSSEGATAGGANRIDALLDSALRSDAAAASTLLEEVSALRRSGEQGKAEEYLDRILAIADEGKDRAPRWASLLSGPTTRFSRRSRRASLSRVLDLSTPSADDEEEEDSEVSAQRRRRRALAVLLRALAKENEEREGTKKKKSFFFAPTIRAVEKAARRGAKEIAATDDMANRLPAGLETPTYEVIARRPPSEGGYEVRRYDAFSVCTVPMNRSRPADKDRTDAKVSQPQLSGASSFGALAGYLFGKNTESASMKMTTPVLTNGEGEDRAMSFVLPSDYWDVDGTDRAPQPLDGSGVRLRRDDGGERAVLMFGGFASKADVEEKKAQLLKALETDDQYQVKDGASVTLAQYNDPFTPPWKRRNEVAVPVSVRERGEG